MSNKTAEVAETVNERVFAVYRSGIRVSDSVYPSDRDPEALHEKRYWEGIIKNWPDGSRIVIREIRWRK